MFFFELHSQNNFDIDIVAKSCKYDAYWIDVHGQTFMLHGSKSSFSRPFLYGFQMVSGFPSQFQPELGSLFQDEV